MALWLPITREKRAQGVNHHIGTGKDVPVGEPQHGVAEGDQSILAGPVSLESLSVAVKRGSIELDEERCVRIGKVGTTYEGSRLVFNHELGVMGRGKSDR
jgi:hypothetical protein